MGEGWSWGYGLWSARWQDSPASALATPDLPESSGPIPLASALSLTQKAKTLEVELAKEKLVCTKDKDGLTVGKRVAEEQLAECSKARDQQQQERQLAEDRLRKVQAFCLSLRI